MFFILKKMTFFNMKIIGQAQYIITEPPILEFYFENRTSPTKRRGEIRKRINSFARFTPIPILLSESVKNGIFSLDGQTKVVLTGFGGGLTWGTAIINL